ncbi:TetR/AcrR family transcriptional regulator [Leptospira semungkisensis]|uniref:TetR/AcrR family transcriptional regulator n=1 Tax=Leptospira semungkisensis TaxID=2484985 RepID=A0A4V3JCM9_9LEPT|nr:TetR/AcrR family transcriptional regulator [Leptospira semungkisensis]TGK06739.1 TetR/AcrR family transcriptional regulator [Leptospira semungkisensis]
MGQKGEIAKEKMVRAMADRLELGGYAGTGLNDIVEDAKAPKGSIYFHFPGGKEELAAQALLLAGKELASQLEGVLGSSKSVSAGIQKVFLALESRLVSSNFSKGCPISTTASETASEPSLVNSTCAGIYQDWTSIFDSFFQKNGIDKTRSFALAISILSLLEGSILISRTNRNTDAIRSAAKTAKILVSLEKQSS